MEYEQPTEDTGPEDDMAAEGQPPKVDAATLGSAPETVNLASTLSEEKKKDYAETVCTDADHDWSSSSKYRTRRAKILKLAVGDIPPPSDGEKFRLARIHYPIIMESVVRLQARLFDQQIPSNGEYFGCKPMDAIDLERAVRVAKHLNWQIAHKVPEYVRNHDVLIQQTLLYGSAFSYTAWDEEKHGPLHEVCRTEDIILPYWRQSTDPSLADLPRITRILRYQRHELEAKERTGYYLGISALYKKIEENKGSTGNDDTSRFSGPVQEVVDKDAGIEKPSNAPGAPRVLLEQHRWLKLEGEDRERPVVITVDYGTKTLLCLKLREDEDPEDRARYNREKAAKDSMYAMAMQKYQADLMAYNAGQMGLPPTQTPMPMPGEMTQTTPPMMGETTSTVPMGIEPTMPTPPTPPKAPRMVTINFFTHFICFPNPEGVYGLGIGTLLEGANVAADTMASQIIDAATLSNTATGLRSRQAKIRGGKLEIAPGEFPECDLSPEQLKNGIFQFKFPGPEPALGALIKDIKEDAKGLSGGGDILSGEVGGSNETATTTQIRIGEATMAITIMGKRYSDSRTCEGKKFARLNSVHLEDEEYFSVVDPFKGTEGLNDDSPIKISRMDYLDDCDIIVTADSRLASQPQRVQEALQALNIINSNPMTAQMMPLVMAALKNLFIAMDRPDLLKGFEQGAAMAAQQAQMGPPPGAPPPGGQPPSNEPPQKASNGPPRPAPVGPKVPNTPAQPANSGIGAGP